MNNNSGMLSLLMIARHHGIAVDEAKLLHEFGRKPFTEDLILLVAKRLGMTAKLVKHDPDRLNRAPMPAIAIDKDGNFFIVIQFGYEGGEKSKPRMIIRQPDSAENQVLELPAFLDLWSGKFIFCI